MRLRYLALSISLLGTFTGLNAQEDLINGREYNRYNIFFTRGIPYFRVDSLTTGSIEFDGKNYDNIGLLYDQVMDEIVMSNLDKSKLLRLVKPRVQRFSMFGTSFINKNNHYYEVLYDGNIQLYKKEKKEIIDDVRLGLDVQRVVKSTVNYYLQKNGKFMSVKSVNSLIKAVDDKEDELEKFAKKNRKKYRDSSTDLALKEVVIYYEQLSR